MKKCLFSLAILGALASSPSITYAQEARSKTISFDQNINEYDAINSYLSKRNLSSDHSFRLIRSTTDKMGYVHKRYQQYYKGIKVEFGTLITHSLNGIVTSITAETYQTSRLNLTPNLTENTSLQKAVQHLGITNALWFDRGTIQRNTHTPSSELVIVPDYSNELNSVVLAYKHNVTASSPGIVGDMYINAHDGSKVLYNPTMKHFNRTIKKTTKKDTSTQNFSRVEGTAETRFIGPRTIETRLENNGTYTLNYDAKNIHTRDALNGNPGSKPYLSGAFEEFVDNDNNWTAAEHDNAAKDNAALDAHYGAMEVSRYWSTVHNRNSFDDNGAAIYSYVHVGNGYFNAFWDGIAMSYGDGGSDPLTGFDICAHEIGHAVTTHTANLVYANQSGGLNEGYSDIWGAAIQHYSIGTGTDAVPDNDVWAIGETIGTFRSLKTPKSHGDPDTYLGQFWVTTGDEGNCSPNQNNDNCGVHTNSGVLNHWFYVLVAGEADTNDTGDIYDVTGIGMSKAEEIAYLALRDYLTPNATYADARAATLAVTSNLYCFNSPEAEAVQNSWYAVNVGNAYQAVDDDINLKSVTSNVDVSCNTIDFSPIATVQNAGNNPISTIELSYSIDGAPAIEQDITTSIASCNSEQLTIDLPTLGLGVHQIDVTTTITNDGRPENNTQSSVVIINESGSTDEVNTFEDTTDVLVAYNEGTPASSLWERGYASTTQLGDNSNQVYGTNLDGNHPDETKAYLVTKCYDLSNSEATFKFDMAFDLETNWDIMYVEYTTDEGATWNVLGTASDPNWYNSNRPAGVNNDCFNCPGNQWTGQGNETTNGVSHATVQEYSYSLSEFDGNSGNPASNIIFRFTFHSDQAVNSEGVVIDNFVIETTPLSVKETTIFEAFTYTPNPTSGSLNVQLTPKFQDQDLTFQIFDISGRSVYNNVYKAASKLNTTLDLGHLNAGLYLMQITQGNQSQIAKIVIK